MKYIYENDAIRLTSSLILSLILVLTLLIGCKDDFLDHPPEDNYNIDNFYFNDDQVLSAGAYLYARPWFKFNEKFFIAIGEIYGGNVYSTHDENRQYITLQVGQNGKLLRDGFNSLYTVVGDANDVLRILDLSKDRGISQEVQDKVRGEALFMRAAAYFFLTRIWDDVPIVANYDDYINNTALPRNPKEDVVQFIINDLNEAITLLPVAWNDAYNGRATVMTATALLAKVSLWKASYFNETSAYKTAKELAGKVINSGNYALNDNFLFNFLPEGDNSKESVFAWQWSGCGTNGGNWGNANLMQAFTAPSGITGVGDGWGTYKPSFDIPGLFEDGDKRRRQTIMELGNFYPELSTKNGGYLYDEKVWNAATKTHFRKYVVGSNDEYPGLICNYGIPVNSSIIRFSDVLLIFAEADRQDDGVLTAEGLKAFNDVRARAGLPPKDAKLGLDDIFHERRVEFLLEGDYWYDVKRQGFTDAKQIIDNQNRSGFGTIEVSLTEEKMALPLPTAEIDANPLLSKPPVPYTF